jgi:hypothetical protein
MNLNQLFENTQGVNEGNGGKDPQYYLRNDIWRVMDGDELVHEYKPERYEVVGAKKLLARFDDEGYDVTHVISPMGVVTYLYGKPEMDEGFDGEYDDEAGMAQGNLHTIARAAQGLLDTIDDQENLPEWVQEKIAKVEGMMVSAWDYLQSQEEQGIDPRQDLDELSPQTLASYVRKSNTDARDRLRQDPKKQINKAQKRAAGMSQAIGKIRATMEPGTKQGMAEIIDYDTLNQLGSHPMAAPLAAAGGAAIGGAIGGGIKKTVDYFQKKKEQKAQARRNQQQGVAEEQLSEIGNTPAGRAALGAVQNRAYNKMDTWSANPTSGYSSTPKDVRKATSAAVAAGNRLHGFGPDNSRENTVMARDALRQKQALRQTQGVAEGKIKLSTDPNWYGAEVSDYKASGPVVNIPANQLVGFEPDDKMNQPASKANVEKIVAGLKQGAKLPPLMVRQYKNGYQVLDGHHRFWAYKLLGVKSIPAQVVPAEDIEEITKQGVAEDWQKANKRDKTDGMSQKAVNAYRREHPGSKLKTAVTTKPGKLKKGSKASKRRKSYCSRSRGQMKMHNISCAKTPDKAICKARRRWNC